MNKQLLREIEAEEERRSFPIFAQRYWHIVEPSTPFVPTRLFYVLCAVLERVARGELLRLVINVPPRCGKSVLVSVLFPAWVLTWQPHTRFLTAGYGEGLAERDSVRCRRVIESERYQQRHGQVVRLRSDQNTKSRFETTRGGARVAVSVGGAATGEGADIGILDDPCKIEDARSPAALVDLEPLALPHFRASEQRHVPAAPRRPASPDVTRRRAASRPTRTRSLTWASVPE